MRRSLRPNAYLRMIENRFVSSEETFVDMAQWDACVSTPPCCCRRILVGVGWRRCLGQSAIALASPW